MDAARGSASPGMASAATAFESYLADTLVLSGIAGRTVFDVNDGIHKLSAQVPHTVRWDLCLQSCLEAGMTTFLELGPGQALATTASNAYPQTVAHGLDAFSTLQGVGDWIAKCAGARGE